MKIIENNIIPFKGFKAINICGFIFKRKDTSPMSEVDINHEKIHTAQMKELLYVFFYLLYLIEYLFNLIIYGNSFQAYEYISFEKEAYLNEDNLDYLSTRRHYSQWK